MLGALQARELTDLGTEPYQEFPSFAATKNFRIRVRNSGPTFRIILLVWVRFRVILGCDVIINMCTALQYCYFFI